MQGHAPLQAAADGGLFVVGEIVPGGGADEQQDLFDKGFKLFGRRHGPGPGLRGRGAADSASISAGISSTGRTWSTAPVRMALRGMKGYLAWLSSWAMVSAPAPFTAWSPRVPSLPVPDKTMQMARSPSSWARDRKK